MSLIRLEHTRMLSYNIDTISAPKKKRMGFQTLIALIAFIIWGALLWILMIGKIVMSSNGFVDYFRHFTNWSWTLSALFFLLDTIAFFLPPRAHARLRYGLAAYGFWFVNGTAWLVFWIVFVILNDNPSLLQAISDTGGYSLGFVFCMDRIFHVLPPLVLWLYASFRRIYFYAALYRWRDRTKQNGTIAHFWWAVYIFCSTLAPVPLLLIYWLIFDVAIVYGLHAPTIVLFGLGASVLIVSNLAPITLLYIDANHWRSNRDAALVLLRKL